MAKTKNTPSTTETTTGKKRLVIWIAVLAIVAAAAAVAITLYVKCDRTKEIELVQPDKTSGIPLMAAIDARASAKEFANTDLDPQTLSEVLWAAWGVNKNGTRTIPTAKNEQNLKVYAIMRDGAYLYNGVENKLERVTSRDLRGDYVAVNQEFVADAPLTLIYVGADERWSAMHAGSSYQNVGLYAASRGLVARVRGSVDANGLKKELNLLENEVVLISITVGNAK